MANKEYIERHALIAAAKKERIVVHSWDDPFEVIVTQGKCFRRIVYEAPAADVVEVVRCKDCEHYRQNPWNNEREMLCQCFVDWHYVEPEDFCSYGQRKEGEQ